MADSDWHFLRHQVTIPAHLTRTPHQAMEKVIKAAAEVLMQRAGHRAFDRSIEPRYEERKTKLGLVWDLLVVLKFRHRGPLPPDLRAMKEFSDVRKMIRHGKSN